MSFSDFLSGVAMATFAGSGVFFLKSWATSGERLFLLFSIAFWLLAGERVLMLFVDGLQESIRTPNVEAGSWVYFVRLSAFALISLAIVDKNRGTSRR